MIQATAPARATISVPARGDHSARAFVWAVWSVLLLIALMQLHIYDNIPVTEDWSLVPALTGHQEHFFSWLWQQNNEHRVPLPKLLLLILLKSSGGDFRIGMVANIALLAGISALLMSAARAARGGRSSFADAFFPVALLHLGNWENLFWSWQISFVLSIVPVLIALVLVVRTEGLFSPVRAAIFGSCLTILPLCGGTGLLFVPFLAMWAVWLGVCAIRGGARRTGWIFLLAVALTALLVAAYFHHYERPAWTGPRPSLGQALMVAIQSMAFAFGPAATAAWIPLTVLDVVLLLATGVWITVKLGRLTRQERPQVFGIAAFFLTTLFYSAAFGYGRGRVISDVYGSWPTRYVLMTVPQLCCVFFVWQLYAPERLRRFLPLLFLTAVALMPVNAALGTRSSSWYVLGKKAVFADLAQGVTSLELAQREGSFLAHSTPTKTLGDWIGMLRDAGVRPFYLVRKSVPISLASAAAPRAVGKSHKIQYQIPGAGEVFLIWGINGWKAPPGGSSPMSTPMIRRGDLFEADLQLPPGAHLDYGFKITKQANGTPGKPVWEYGAPTADASPLPANLFVHSRLAIEKDGAADYLSGRDLRIKHIRYRLPEAAQVNLVWGVEGWYALPPANRPTGTTIRNGLMITTMTRDRGAFTAKLAVPSEVSIDYGFFIPNITGLFDLPEPVWDGRPDYRAAARGSDTIDVTPKVDLSEWTRLIPSNGTCGRIVALTSLLWAVLFGIFELWSRRAALKQLMCDLAQSR